MNWKPMTTMAAVFMMMALACLAADDKVDLKLGVGYSDDDYACSAWRAKDYLDDAYAVKAGWDRQLVKVSEAETLGKTIGWNISVYWAQECRGMRADSVTMKPGIRAAMAALKSVYSKTDKFNIDETAETLRGLVNSQQGVSKMTLLILNPVIQKANTMVVYAMKHPDIKDAGGREYALRLWQSYCKALLANIDLSWQD